MGRAKRLRKLKVKNRRERAILRHKKHMALETMRSFMEAFPSLSEIQKDIAKRLEETHPISKVVVYDGPSALAIGSAFHRALDTSPLGRCHRTGQQIDETTCPTVIMDEFCDVDPSVYTKLLERFQKDNPAGHGMHGLADFPQQHDHSMDYMKYPEGK